MRSERPVVVGVFPGRIPVLLRAPIQGSIEFEEYSSLREVFEDVEAKPLDAVIACLSTTHWPSADDIATLRNLSRYVPVMVLVEGTAEFVRHLGSVLGQDDIHVLPAASVHPERLQKVLLSALAARRTRRGLRDFNG